MKKISDTIVNFLHNQGCVVVSTIDEKGFVHNACKGIIKISPGGKIYLLDLYQGQTYHNLKRNPHISVTAIDEHKFAGYCLKGKAELTSEGNVPKDIIKAWEERIASRLTRRLLKNIREEKGHPRHPEVLLPQPQYMIVLGVEDVVDLTPHHLK